MGGPKEINILSNKLNIAIEEYIPNPIDKSKLTSPTVIKPKNRKIVATIGIIQDHPYQEELQKEVQNMLVLESESQNKGSGKEKGNPQHFRLKSTNDLLPLVKKEAILSAPPTNTKKTTIHNSCLKEIEKIEFEINRPQSQSAHDEPIPIDDNQQTADLNEERILRIAKRANAMPPSVEKYLSTLLYYLYYLSNKKENRVLGSTQGEGLSNNNSSDEAYSEPMISEEFTSNVKLEKLTTLHSKVKEYVRRYIKSGSLITQINPTMKSMLLAIQQKKWELSFKEVSLLLRLIEPLNIQETLFYSGEAKRASSFIKGQNVILFIGTTGVGKSTTLLYLMGCNMKEKVDNTKLTHIEADLSPLEEKYKKQVSSITTSAKARSETRYITGVAIDSKDFIGRNPKRPKIILCDTPGFEDSAGPEVDIANGTGVINAIQKAKGVTLALLLDEHSIYAKRMQPVVDLVYLVAKMIPKFTDNRDAFTYLFTKVTPNRKGEIHSKFENLLDEEEKGNVKKFDNAARKFLINIELATKKRTWIVDPLRNMNNTPESDIILEHLIQKATYIENPQEVFSNYLSQTSLNYLKEQLAYHKSTILIAIQKKDFLLAQYKLDEVRSIEEELKHSDISFIYKDISKSATASWNQIGNNAINTLRKHLLSENMLKNSKLDQYLITYNLYDHFNENLRKKNLQKQAISSTVFLQELKKMLFEIRMKFIEQPLDNPKKTNLYLQKLNNIAQLLKEFSPFVEETNERLAEHLRAKEKEALDFIELEEFEKVGPILKNIKKATPLQEVVNKKIVNIEQHYNHIKNNVIDYIQVKVVEKGYGVLRVDSTSEYLDLDLSNHDAIMLKKYYTVTKEAVKVFKENSYTIEVSKAIDIIYNDFVEKGVSAIKTCAKKIKNLLDPNISKRAPSDIRKANKLSQSVITLRKIDVICNKTYDESALIQSLISNYLENTGLNIGELVRKIFILKDNHSVDDSPDSVNKLLRYVDNIRHNSLLGKNERDAALAPLKEVLKRNLQKIYTSVEKLNLSLNGSTNFDKIKSVLKLLSILNSSKLGEVITSVSNYKHKILRSIRKKTMQTVHDIKITFNEEGVILEKKQALLDILENYQKAHETLNKPEEDLEKDIKNLSNNNIQNKKLLEKEIKNLAEKNDDFNQKIAEQEELKKSKTKEVNSKLNKIKTLLKIRSSYDVSDDAEKDECIKAINNKGNTQYESIKECLDDKKKVEATKKSIEEKINNKIKEIKSLQQENNNQKKKYEKIIKKYTKAKKEQEKEINSCLKKLSEALLTHDKLERLRKTDLELAQKEIVKIKNQIQKAKVKKVSFLFEQLDANKAVMALKYLKEAQEIDWLEYQDMNDDQKSEDLEILEDNMKFTLQKTQNNLKKYLKKYAKELEKEVSSMLNNLPINNNQGNNEEQKIDTKVIERLNNCFHEMNKYKIDNNLLTYFEFSDHSNPGSQFIEQLIEIFDHLESKSKKIIRSKNFKRMINESQIAKKMSRLDRWMSKNGNEANKKFNNIYNSYLKEIYKKVDNKEILEKIKQRNYQVVDQEIRNLLKRENDVNENDPEIKNAIKDIEITLCTSIENLVGDIEELISDLDIDDNNKIMNKTRKDYKSIKDLDKVNEVFFSKEDMIPFLRNFKSKFDDLISELQDLLDDWIIKSVEIIQNHINSNNFLKAKSKIGVLDKLYKNLKKTKKINSRELKNVINKLQRSTKNQLVNIRNKFRIEVQSNQGNPLVGLTRMCESLNGAGEGNQVETILGTVEDEYRAYVTNLSNNLNLDLEEENEQLNIANDMLTSMPKSLSKKLISLYRSTKTKVENRQKVRKKRIDEIKERKTPQQHVESWNEYKRKRGKKDINEYNTITSMISKESENIQIDFGKSLVKHNLEAADKSLEKLQFYTEELNAKDFRKTYKIYEEVENQKFKYGNQLLEEFKNQIRSYERLKENPDRLNKLVASLNSLEKYQKTFFK